MNEPSCKHVNRSVGRLCAGAYLYSAANQLFQSMNSLAATGRYTGRQVDK